MSIGPYILLLPDVALENIFSFLTYDEIAKNREVCKRFNDVGSNFLSRGFIQAEKRHSAIYKRVKSLLPRRESERRTHPLARHCDILSAVETRISKVIDEIERVLRVIESKGPPPRTHELLQELRDISSMAMEHFEEQILPNLKMQIEQPPIIPLLPPTSSKSSKFVLVECAIADEIHKIKKQNKNHQMQFTVCHKLIAKINRKVKRQNLKLKSQTIKLREQERKIQEQTAKIQEQEMTMADLRKHMDEWEQKFSDLTAEVRAKDDFITKTKNSSQLSTLPAKFHLPNIKPRKAQVLPKTAFSNIHAELERKRKSPSQYEIPNKLSRNVGLADAEFILPIGLKTNLKKDEGNNNNFKIGIPADLGKFTSNVIGSLLANPIASIKSRKRKIPEDLELDIIKK